MLCGICDFTGSYQLRNFIPGLKVRFFGFFISGDAFSLEEVVFQGMRGDAKIIEVVGLMQPVPVVNRSM
jgi:hypothetical protein